MFRDDYIEGQGLRQTCFVSQGDPPMLVSWFRDGAPVESSESIRITRIDEVTSLLAISDLSSHQAGNYSCVAKNEVAVVSVTASLVVRGNPAPHSLFACYTYCTCTVIVKSRYQLENVQKVSTISTFKAGLFKINTFLTFLPSPASRPNLDNFLPHKMRAGGLAGGRERCGGI